MNANPAILDFADALKATANFEKDEIVITVTHSSLKSLDLKQKEEIAIRMAKACSRAFWKIE